MLRNELVDMRSAAATIASDASQEKESTDLSMFVRTSADEIVAWNRERIVEALIKETGVRRELAEIIGLEVEKQVKKLSIEYITAPLVRELVDVKLLEYGLEDTRKKHTRLGVPIYDVKQIIFHKNRENANTPHNPEATNLTLSENIKKEFALLQVFSGPVADAHMVGDIHIHDLGFIDRPYCSGQSIEFIKKFGLSLPEANFIALPAEDADTLISQIVKFSLALHGNFAGAIGWDAVNVFLAPYIEGFGKGHIRKLAKMLIEEFSHVAVARGGQGVFSDLNIYYEIPRHFEEVPAIGRGGKYTGKLYKDYQKEAQMFAEALFEVYMEGDGAGRPYFFPKPLVHITEKFFKTEGHEKFLDLISDVAAEKGNTYYVFDRGDTAKISECCRLSFKLEQSDLDDAKEPWKMRYSAIQNITMNLPRAAYRACRQAGKAGGSDEKLFEELTRQMELAVAAHIQKRAFIEQLLSLGNDGPLSLLAMKKDGEPYLRLRRVTHLIGMLGLNELVQFHTGRQLHESDDSVKFGMKVIAFMKLKCEEFSKVHNMHFVLEQTPAESTAYRFAKLDMKHHNSAASTVMKGSMDAQNIYYTNSTYFNISCPMNPVDRVVKEGLFHPLIDAGALTHVWLGEARPSSQSIANFVVKTFRNSSNSQIAFSPEFTTCNSCGKTVRGIKDKCMHCGSSEVECMTRITGYFSKISGWNKGKLGELADRYKSQEYFSVDRGDAA